MENPATGLVEYLRRQNAAGRPMPPFVLLGRGASAEAIHTALKAAQQNVAAETTITSEPAARASNTAKD